jgi:hypothetical protein
MAVPGLLRNSTVEENQQLSTKNTYLAAISNRIFNWQEAVTFVLLLL